MVAAPLRKLYPLIPLALAACAAATLEEQVRAEGLAPASVVRLEDDLAVVALRDGGRVRVMEFAQTAPGSWTKDTIATSTTGTGVSSAHLVSTGGDTGTEWNSYFYGTAPPSVSRVVLEGLDATGGQVVDGAWVLALREKDLTPDDMRWKFVDAVERVIESGTGIFPADS